jgi:hypothetical protein
MAMIPSSARWATDVDARSDEAERRSSVSRTKVTLEQLSDEFSATAHSDFVEDRLTVVLHGIRGYVADLGDLLSGETPSNKLKELAFPA